MIAMSLMGLAMNPNLSKEQFEELSAEMLARHQQAVDNMMEAANRLPLEQRLEFLLAVSPVIL